MGKNKTKKNSKKDIKQSFIKILKDACKKYIETESNPAGILNLIFGIIIVLLILVLCVDSIATKIASIFCSSISTVPWYVTVIFFIVAVIYFYFCVKSLGGIQKLQNHEPPRISP